MSRALREMQLMIQSQRVDLVIETRDARMPLTSLNPAFEQILDSAGGKGAGLAKRLIVYNKSDLAQECFQEVRALLSPFVMPRRAEVRPFSHKLIYDFNVAPTATR